MTTTYSIHVVFRVENLTQSSKRIHKASVLSTLKYMNLGGPGGKLLRPETVAKVLYAFQNLISLWSYPFMGQVGALKRVTLR